MKTTLNDTKRSPGSNYFMMGHLFRAALSVPLLLTVVSGYAQTTRWTNNALGDWTIASNWNNGVPNSSGTNARIEFGAALLTSLNATTGNLSMFDQGSLFLSKAGSAPPGSLTVEYYLSVGIPRLGGGQRGALDISHGATLSAGNGPWGIGTDIGIYGSVTVSDANSILYTGALSVAPALGTGSGTAFLTIRNGGKVISTSSEVAPDAMYQNQSVAVNGTVLVTGTGSQWISTENLIVGGTNGSATTYGRNGGIGILQIQSGGYVQASSLRFFSNGTLAVDNGSSLTPGFVLSGGKPVPFRAAPDSTLGDMVVGNTTGGRMEIKNGGTASSHRGFIGMNPGADGAVTVSGVGSQWDCTGSIWAGNSGVGSLDVLNGGIVTSAGHGYLGLSPNTSGYANVSGNGSYLIFDGNLYVGGNAAAAGGSGTLRIEKDGAVSARAVTLYPGGTLQLGANPRLYPWLTVLNGAIEAIADITTFSNDFTVGAGVLSVYTSTHRAIFHGRILGSGGLTKQSAGFTMPQHGTLELTGASSYSGATTVSAGTLLVEGSITSDVTVNSGGTLAGNGSVGSVTVNAGGGVAPGNSPGRLTVNGDYTQTSGATLKIQIGGNTPGAGGYDQLVITGAASLGGTLELTLVDGFHPAVGDTYSIVTSNSETGSFSAINSPGITVSSDAGASGITLTIMAIAPPLIVTTTADHDDGSCEAGDCTLREAINAANARVGDHGIFFAPGVTGTIQLASALPVLSSSIAFHGPGADVLTVRRDTGGAYRIFTINPGTVVSFCGLTIANGNASQLGGAIYNDHAAVSLTDCAVTGNAAYSGGGIYSQGSTSGIASLTLTNTTLSANSATGQLGLGGAIYSQGTSGGTAILSLTNCTVTGNTSVIGTRGIESFGSNGNATATLRNCTFSGNNFSNDQATLLVANTIFDAGGGGATLTNFSGTITSQGHNLSSDAVGGDAGTDPGGFLNAAGDKRNTNARLAPAGLANNGGPTTTIALLSNSPAINAGNDALSPKLDQRGYLRLGVSDIGAFEFGSAAPSLEILSVTRSGIGDVVLLVAGVPNGAHRIQASVELSLGSFIDIATVTADATGLFLYQDTRAGLTRNFYRVAFP